MMQHKYLILTIALLISITMLTACNKKNKKTADLHKFVAELKAKADQVEHKSITINLNEPYVYKLDANQNPFIEKSTINQQTQSNSPVIAQPLQHYQLAQLKLVGTLTTNTKKWALIETPDNAIYQITIGDDIGSEGGKIVDISTHTIKIKHGQQVVTLHLNNV